VPRKSLRVLKPALCAYGEQALMHLRDSMKQVANLSQSPKRAFIICEFDSSTMSMEVFTIEARECSELFIRLIV